MNIRKAEKRDVSRILELVKELATFEKSPESVIVTEKHFTEAGFGQHSVWWGFVLEIEGKIEGFALCYTRFSTWRGKICYLEDFYITPEHRSKGYGKELFDIVLDDSRAKAFQYVCWQVLDWNVEAIKFYEKYANTEFDGQWVNCLLSLENVIRN